MSGKPGSEKDPKADNNSIKEINNEEDHQYYAYLSDGSEPRFLRQEAGR
jgi:hypothetical protein